MMKKTRKPSSSSTPKEEEEVGEAGMSTKWSKQLPKEIIQLILQKLWISYYIRCGAVCPSWRSAAADMASSMPFSFAPQLPWLMLINTKTSTYSTIDHYVVSLSEDHKLYKTNSLYNIQMELCYGSIEGWLIMADAPVTTLFKFDDQDKTTRVFFLNPVSGVKVLLPAIPQDLRYRVFLRRAVASSLPTSPSCIVAAVYSTGALAFCRPLDELWTVINPDAELAKGLRAEFSYDMEIIDEKLYVLVERVSQTLFVFDIHIDDEGDCAHSYTAERLITLQPELVQFLDFLPRRKNLTSQLFKDATSKELFMTSVLVSESWPHTEGFRVFKLQHDQGRPRWTQVTDLGNRILFLSKNSGLFVPSSANDYGKTLERNRIYFVFEGGYEFGVFSLTNGSIHHYTFPFPKDRYSTYSTPFWFTPNLW